MSISIRPGNDPPAEYKTTQATEVLDEVLKHVPLTLVVELVESRYRDRRNKFFATIIGAVLSVMIASVTVAYQMYTRTEATEQDEQRQQRQEERNRLIESRRTERTQELARTATRLQFARTVQSFEDTDGTLETNRSLAVELGPGERKEFLIDVISGGRYSIRVTASQRAEVPSGATELEVATTNAVAFTPVMYLYQLGDGIVNPVAASTRRSLSFDYEDEGTYFLEVEELLRDPGEFMLTVTEGDVAMENP